MNYQGSKTRLMKKYAPIIGGYIKKINDFLEDKGANHNVSHLPKPIYIEPFVGGANSLIAVAQWCKQNTIVKTYYGNDENKYLISLLDYIKKENTFEKDMPLPVTKEFYNDVKESYKNDYEVYQNWIIGAVGFHTFNAEFMGSFTSPYKKEREAGYINYSPKRSAHLINAYKKLGNMIRDIGMNSFIFQNYNIHPYLEWAGKILCNWEWDYKYENIGVIYLDPPYYGARNYRTQKTEGINYDILIEQLDNLSGKIIILLSEYSLDAFGDHKLARNFKCIAETDLICNYGGKNKEKRNDTRVERLYLYNKGLVKIIGE